MDPLITGLLSSLPGIAKTIFGGKQQRMANRLMQTERPEFQIPDAIKEMLANSQMVAGMRELPGQKTMEQKMASSTASGLSAAKEVSDSPASTLGALSDLYGQQTSALGDLNVAAGDFWASNQGQLQKSLGEYAD